MTAPITLRCPKCHADMATYERNGVVIDQCRECRGVFLDRGELERLVDAEEERFRTAARPAPNAAIGAPSPYAAPGQPYPVPTQPYPGAAPYGAPDAPWVSGDPYDPRRGRRDWDDDDDDDRRRYDDRQGRRSSKKRSLLGELLEGLGD